MGLQNPSVPALKAQARAMGICKHAKLCFFLGWDGQAIHKRNAVIEITC